MSLFSSLLLSLLSIPPSYKILSKYCIYYEYISTYFMTVQLYYFLYVNVGMHVYIFVSFMSVCLYLICIFLETNLDVTSVTYIQLSPLILSIIYTYVYICIYIYVSLSDDEDEGEGDLIYHIPYIISHILYIIYHSDLMH
jgi:hypothetical protein